MLEIENIKKIYDIGMATEKEALRGINLSIMANEFITIIGGNGAGKSTVLNAIAGSFSLESGSIKIDGKDITKTSEHSRARYIGRVFQDPRIGTSPVMTIEENLAIALRRGKKRTLRWGISAREREMFHAQLQSLELGLEHRMNTRVGLLSGGQRQALTLLMATIKKPHVLLLDEHTASLDPKTAKVVLSLTGNIVRQKKLTTIMVTHNMRDALNIGNRIIMMHEGIIILDVKGTEKTKLSVSDLLRKFESASGTEIVSDRLLLN